MAIIQKYYPPVSDLIDLSSLPSNFDAVKNLLEQGADLLLKKIFYKNLTVEVSNSGDSRFYYLVILSRSLKLPLLADINLVFFKGSEVNMSEFPIVFEWQWPLFKYFPKFKTRGFSYAPEAFLDIFIELAQINGRKEFFDQIVSVFLDNGDDAYIDFLDRISSYISIYNNANVEVANEIQNIQNNINIIKDELHSQLTTTNLFTLKSLYDNYERISSFNDAVLAIKTSINNLEENFNLSINLYRDVLINLLLGLSNIKEKFSKLVKLFRHWIEDISEEDIKSLLIPQFSLRLNNINMGLEFPRKWLTPVYTGVESVSGLNINDPLPEPYRSTLEFNVGNLIYSTRTGFRFENQSSFVFKRSLIGNTGLLVEFSDLKVDMSDSYNIPEANADGRPENFQGVYAAKAAIILPSKWFNDVDNSTLQIAGYNMLVGTGGVSGTIALEAVSGRSLTDNDYLNVKIGNWTLGFNRFDIKLKQNDIVDSNLRAQLTIPKFKNPNGDIAKIDVVGHLQGNGEFQLTASTTAPHPVIEFGDVFKLHMKSVELGREEDDFYIGTVADIEFKGFLNTLLEGQGIVGTDLRIYSNGQIDFKVSGGNLVLAKTVKLKLGPVEIAVSSIHFGSHEREKDGKVRKYNYFGFDAGVSVGVGGVDARGDGIKYYYTVDDGPGKPHDAYLHIQTIHVDLTFPAGEKDPTTRIKGWLSIPEPGVSNEYKGRVDLTIKKPAVTGHVEMSLSPKDPSFLLEAGVELPNPIPMGPVSIYGFKGLLGYRYVAEKSAIGMNENNSWYDYYKAPQRGVGLDKFSGPAQTADYKTPFSLGVGAIIGDSAAAGNIVSANAMLLLSLPSMVMVDARMKLLSNRVTFSEDPPLFAFFIFGDNSLEFGFGADYKFPNNTGDLMKVNAEVKARFLFDAPSAWYINFGTKDHPITAKLLKDIFTLKAFLMLSAKGIEAGAGGEFRFERSYGPVSVKALAYLELGGNISFERSQIGAYLQAGLSIDVNVKAFRLYLATNTLLKVEGPKPFLIYGKFDVTFTVNLFLFKLNFKQTLELKWEFNKTIDSTPINPFTGNISGESNILLKENSLVKGISMLTGETFELANLRDSNGDIELELDKIKTKVIPLDTYIDIKTTKALLPTNMRGAKIGGFNNAPSNYTDLIPPQKIVKGLELRQVKHQYSIESIDLMAYSPTMNSWMPYNPYKVVAPNVNDPQLDQMPIGQWQKKDNQYNAIRLLATTPFSYTEMGAPGWFTPEKYGVTTTNIFCETERRQAYTSNFLDIALNTQYYPYNNNFFYSKRASYQIQGNSDYTVNTNDNTVSMIGDYAKVSNEFNNFNFNRSLQFSNHTPLTIMLSAPSAEVELKLTTYSSGLYIEFYKSINNEASSHVEYELVDRMYKTRTALENSVITSFSALDAISKIIIIPEQSNQDDINRIMNQMAALMNSTYDEILSTEVDEVHNIEVINLKAYSRLERELTNARTKGCQSISTEKDENACKVYPTVVRYWNNFFTLPYIDLLSNKEDKENKEQKDWNIPIQEALFIRKNVDNYKEIIDKIQNPFKEEDTIYQQNVNELYTVIDFIEKEFPEDVYDSDYNTNKAIRLANSVKDKFSNLKEIISRKRDCIDEVLCNLSQSLSYLDFAIIDKEGLVESSPMLEAFNNFILHNPDYEYLKELLFNDIEFIKSVLGAKESYKEYKALYDEVCRRIIDTIKDLGNCNKDDLKCFTLFHEVKWTTLEDYQFNLSIPGQAAITEDVQQTVDGINKYVQPIWRPDTYYCIKFTLKDTVGDSQTPATYNYTYGFRTAGPVGFFHDDSNSPYGTINNAEKDQISHTSIRAYIDYERSYPNADGNLLSAKPLFYDDESSEILLYFKHRYAIKHFEGWDAVMEDNTIKFPELGGTMKIIIKDPAEDIDIVNPPRLDTTIDNIESAAVNIPQTIEHWEEDTEPLIPPVLNQWFNLLNANNCTGIRELIKPKSYFRKVTPKRLKPQKLYTAQVLNFYWGTDSIDISNINELAKSNYAREVHKFVFQTSRYSNFKAQIQSCFIPYIDTDGLSKTKTAVYKIEQSIPSNNIQAALDIIKGIPNTLSNAISQQFLHPFDRIIEGVFELPALNSAVTTEFTKIINSDTDEIIALLIRNPEPFNHPKIPLKDIIRTNSQCGTVEVLQSDLSTIDEDYYALFSKDYSQVLIMNNNKCIETEILNFQFIYKTWNGSEYSNTNIQQVMNISMV